MAWNDDSWRDSYDAWKLRSPDDDYDEPECDCSEAELTWEGRFECHQCGRTWYATAAEMEAESERVREYAEWENRENRREFWKRVTLWFRWPLFRLLEKVWPRKSCGVLYDEEIPF